MRVFFEEILATEFGQWTAAALTTLIVFVALTVAHRQLVKRLRKPAAQTATLWDDFGVEVVAKTHRLFFLAIGVFLGTHFVQLPERWHVGLRKALFLVLLIQVLTWGTRFIEKGVELYLHSQASDDGSRQTTVRAAGFILRIVLYSVVLLWGLDNFGVDITALVAGLGVGGVAVALALQNILGDLFASLTIVLDKPFVLGDFIVVGEHMGTIENVGLKTTRVRSLSGEQLIFPNADLLQSRIRNFKRMQERRVVFGVGIAYETPYEIVEKIPAALREAVESQRQVRFDRAHFRSYGDSSLDFEVVYWVLSADYNIYMDIQQNINLSILRRFTDLGVNFAYPTRTVHVAPASFAAPNELRRSAQVLEPAQ